MHNMESAGRKFSLQAALDESFSYVFGRFAEFAEKSWKYFAASRLMPVASIGKRRPDF